jgi:hypothetical protein
MKSFFNNNRFLFLSNLFIWLGILYSFFWLCFGSYFLFPNAEDLSVTEISRSKGIVKGAADLLQGFDGRYFTNILHGINPLSINWIDGYKLMPVFALLLFTFSLFFLLKSIVDQKNLKLLKYSFLISAVIFSSSPAPVNHFFWMISSFVYLYPWIFIFLWIGSTIRFFKTRLFKWYFLSLVLMYLSFGLNEMFLIFNIVLIFEISRNFLKTNINLKIVYLLWIVGLLSILMFVLSPGIIFRLSIHANSREGSNFIEVIFVSFINYIVEFKLLLFVHPSIILSIFFLVLSIPSNSILVFYKLNIRNSILIFLLLNCLFYIMTFAYYFSMGIEFKPLRVYSALQPGIYFSLLFLAFIFFNQKWSFFKNSSLIQFFLSVLLLVSFTTGHNTMNNIKQDFQQGKLQRFKKVMDIQFSRLNKEKETNDCWKSVELEFLNEYPNSIFSPPIICPNRVEDSWNLAYEKYFELDEVYIKDDSVRSINYFKKSYYKLDGE